MPQPKATALRFPCNPPITAAQSLSGLLFGPSPVPFVVKYSLQILYLGTSTGEGLAKGLLTANRRGPEETGPLFTPYPV